MIATLSALTFDTLGFVRIPLLPDADVRGLSRRVNTTQTLDGGVAVNDFGLSPADKTIVLRWRTQPPSSESVIARIFRLHARLTVTLPDGVYLAAPQNYTINGDTSVLTLLAIRKLSED